MIFRILIFVLLPSACFAQATGSLLRGTITDTETHLPLQGVVLTLKGKEQLTVMSDSLGKYELRVPSGNYRLEVSHPAFTGITENQVALVSGKQRVIDFELKQKYIRLSSVTVQPQNEARDFSLDLYTIQQVAAVFYDPARLAYSHAGVINVDDGTNQTSVRGTSPNYLQWRLEEVEILSPNHLENAGTINDRPAINGGGVSMISAQLLEKSTFRFAPTAADAGNMLSGLYDMKLRNGNNSKREYIVQASLLGTDLAMEGPFNSKKKSSYLINLRYSTIGLLSMAGIDFGNERSNFMDLSFMTTFPHKKGVLKIFGMNGQSATRFAGMRDTNLISIQKELQNIDYNSRTFINGFSNLSRLSHGFLLKNVVVFSKKDLYRIAEPSALSRFDVADELDEFKQNKLSSVHYISTSLSRRIGIRAGSHFNYQYQRMNMNDGKGNENTGELEEGILQPFVSTDIKGGRHFEYKIGLHSQYLPRIGYFSLQPRAEVTWLASERNQVLFSYGKTSQLHPLMFYLAHPANQRLRPTENHAFSLLHSVVLGMHTLKTEVFFQDFRHVAINSEKQFSGFNYYNEQIFFALSNAGRGRVYGADVRAETRIQDFYSIVSATVYNSLFSFDNKHFSAARFNCGYNFFITAGKEYWLKEKRSALSTDVRAMYRNGFRENGDVTSSNNFNYNSALPEYWRIDLRIAYKKNKTKSTTIWALDLQNLTNRRNVAYHYYDAVTMQKEKKYLLGLIPVLSYKVMF